MASVRWECSAVEQGCESALTHSRLSHLAGLAIVSGARGVAEKELDTDFVAVESTIMQDIVAVIIG